MSSSLIITGFCQNFSRTISWDVGSQILVILCVTRMAEMKEIVCLCVCMYNNYYTCVLLHIYMCVCARAHAL